MAKYRLVDWEDNRYHDSYGRLIYFDDQDGKMHITEHWSTAYPSSADMSEYLMPTVEIVEKAKKELADFYFDQSARIFLSLKFRPEADEVKEHGEVILNSNFNGRKQGKIAKGTVCKVLRVTLSSFAPNRYGKEPYRHDYNCEVLTPDGRKVWLRLDKLTLTWECPTEKDTMEAATRRAQGCQFQDISRCGWLSNNWAIALYNNKTA